MAIDGRSGRITYFDKKLNKWVTKEDIPTDEQIQWMKDRLGWVRGKDY